MKHTKVVVVTNLGINQMWKEIEKSVMFEFFMITLQCDLFTMKKISNSVFKCIKKCFPKWK
jgi:hypothetical protein